MEIEMIDTKRKKEFELRVLSLGAGVQSTAMYLKAVKGEFTPMPDVAIFADTQAEPRWVMENLEWLQREFGSIIPIHIVTSGDLGEDWFNGGTPRSKGRTERTVPAAMPFHIMNHDGGKGMLQRQCTQRYKLEPIHREVRSLLGLRPGQRAEENIVEMWIGISTDEAQRMKPARERYIQHRWPLAEGKGHTRTDLIKWMEASGYPIPRRSACYFCPFRSDAEWMDLSSDQQEWDRVISYDRRIRESHAFRPSHATGIIDGDLYLHPSLKPIGEVTLDRSENQLDLFGNECEGMCGV